jgi:cold shock CspA family protein
MQIGIVKWFNKTKGIGAITPLIGGDDVCVYQWDLLNQPYLLEGQRVQFKIEIQPKWFVARQVSVLNS